MTFVLVRKATKARSLEAIRPKCHAPGVLWLVIDDRESDVGLARRRGGGCGAPDLQINFSHPSTALQYATPRYALDDRRPKI